MKVSIIIPTRNRIHCLERCLRSLEDQKMMPYEVIIIFHKDDSDTRRFLKNLSTNLHVKYFETIGGSCKGRNDGIDHASGEILGFIDDDVILHTDYINNLTKLFKKEVNVVAGYTFDIVDLTTPWLIRKDEIEFIINDKDDEFLGMINEEISINYPEFSRSLKNKYKLIIYSFFHAFRNFLKILILQEGFKKGKILPSGYRSEMPSISKVNDFKKVEWVNGGNFAAKKEVMDKFKFNEDIEILPYALAEDLELSARLGMEYDIYLSPDLKLFHLRSVEGMRLNQQERFKSMVVNFRRVADLRGNRIAYWWGIIGLMISRIFSIPFSYNIAISQLKGILAGINYLRGSNG